METLDEIVRDYDQNKVLKVCQRQALDYLSEQKGYLCRILHCALRIFRHVVQNDLT